MTRRALLALAALLVAAPAAAQEYPTRPIRLIIASAPGGGTDILGRIFAERLAARLGQPVVADNRPGAGGNLAAEAVVRAPADGHTLLMHHDGFVANAGLYPRLPYDPRRDFAPVGIAARGTLVFGVGAAVPVRSLDELLALARARPGAVAYASCGTGTAQHIAGEMLKAAARVDMPHVSYRGCAPALTDAIAGTVPAFVQSLGNVVDAAREGRVRLLAVASAHRSPDFPELPTVQEAGFPGFEAHPWYGILAPTGTPAPIVARLSAAMRDALAEPGVQARLAAMRFDADPVTPEEFAAVIGRDLDRLTRVIREAGITLE